MIDDDIWLRLAVEPTNDIQAIRRAYARQLKKIDADRDPDAFMALRAAREQAIAQANSGDHASLPAEGDGPEPGDPASSSAPMLEGYGDVTGLIPATPPVKADGPLWQIDGSIRTAGGESKDPLSVDVPLWSAVIDVEAPGTLQAGERRRTPAYDDHYQALRQMLLETPEPEEQTSHRMLSATAEDDANRHIDTLLADPRLDDVVFYADAERWFGEVLASSVPTSDPLLRRVSAFFGWTERAGRIDQSATLDFVTQRIASLDFVDAVQRKGHPYNVAWRELTRPSQSGSKRDRGIRRSEIIELLTVVRRNHPDLETRFDWYRVTLWETPPKSRTGSIRIIALVIWIGFQIVSAISRNHAQPQEPPPILAVAGGLSDEESDIAFALSGVFDGELTPADLKASNPALYQLLQTNWIIARNNGNSRTIYAQHMKDVLLGRYKALMPTLHGAQLVDIAHLHLDEATALRSHRASACDDFFKGKPLPAGAIPESLADRGRALAVAILLHDNADPARTDMPKSFHLSGDMIAEMAERGSMDRNAFIAALKGGGTPTTRCNARIALLEAVLAMPAKPRDELLSSI